MLNPAAEKKLQAEQRRITHHRRKTAPIDTGTLSKIERSLAKLRPLRDELKARVGSMPGFGGMAITKDGIIMYAIDELVASRLKAIAGNHKKVIVEVVKQKQRKAAAPKFG